MIPTVEFDPCSLTVWTTAGTLLAEEAERVTAVMAAAVHGGDPLSAVADLPKKDPRRRRALLLASCVWHEKRHLFDICLTNCGARQFRDVFNLAVNALPLVAEALHRNEPVWFPVEVYGCPTKRRLRGISDPPPNITDIARRAHDMKMFASKALNASSVSTRVQLHIGGNAQLEGLAQASQMNSIAYKLGTKEAIAVTAEHVHHLPLGGPYRSIEAVAGALGCIREIARGVNVVNVGLASALFITALSGRFFGVGRNAPEEFVSPWLRLARLIEALGPTPGRFDMSDEAAWELVDGATRHLWGRTALEEIADDIDAMDAAGASLRQPWLTEEGLPEAWADFVTLRRRLLTAVQQAGPASLSPRAFPVMWLDRLLPWHIVATPYGETKKDDDAQIVFGRNFNVPPDLKHVMPPLVVWGRLHEAPSHRTAAGFAPSDRGAWLQMLERHGPRARLMLNGRRYRRMVPPELERPIEEFAEWGVKVCFEPAFEWPADRDHATRVAEAQALAEWSGRTSFICDITGEEIAVADAAVLTPWEFRRSSLLSHFREACGAEIIAEFRLASDWSDWIVRANLLPA